MKRYVVIAVAMLVLGVAVGVAAVVLANPTKQVVVQQWEYLTLNCGADADGCSRTLNDFGVDGWELVSVVVIPPFQVTVYFKRSLGA